MAEKKKLRLINPHTGFDSEDPATYHNSSDDARRRETEEYNKRLRSSRLGPRTQSFSSLNNVRNFEEYVQKRRQHEEMEGRRSAAQKLQLMANAGSVSGLGDRMVNAYTTGMFERRGQTTERPKETERAAEQLEEGVAKGTADMLARQSGYKKVGDRVVFATPNSPLPDPDGIFGVSKAEAPDAYGIRPSEYAKAMQNISNYLNMKAPERQETQVSGFLQKWFPEATETPFATDIFVKADSLPKDQQEAFWTDYEAWQDGTDQQYFDDVKQRQYERDRAKAKEKYDAAIQMLGEDAPEYLSRRGTDYYERYATGDDVEQIAKEYESKAKIDPFNFEEGDAVLQSVLYDGEYSLPEDERLVSGNLLLNRNMSEEQRMVYMYLASKYGKETAADYYNQLVSDGGYSKQAYEMREKALREATDENWFAESAKSLLSAPAQAVGTMYSIRQALGGEKIDPYSNAYAASQMTQVPRSQTQQIFTEKYGKVDEKTGEIKDTLKSWLMKAGYNVVTSAIDSRTSAFLSGRIPGVGAALQGVWNMGGDVQDALARGGSDEQALWLGGINAIVETATEYLPMESLVKAIDGRDIKTIKDVLVSAAKGAMSEAPGEALSELGNSMADSYIMGELSNWKQAVQEKGAAQAAKDLAFDVLTSGFVGALSGGGSNTMAATGSYIGNRVWQKELDAAAQQYDAEQQAKAEAEAPQAAPAQLEAEQKPDVRDELLREYTPETAQVEVQQAEQAANEEEPAQKEKHAEVTSEGEKGQIFSTARGATMRDEDGVESRVRVVGVMMDDNVPVMVTETEDGETDYATADELTFDDEMGELLSYEGVASMDAKGLRNYLEGYDAETATAEEYAEAYNAVYHRAKAGLDYDQAAMQNEAARQHLTEGARMSAYAAGQNAYNQTHDTGSAEIVSETPETGASEASYSIKEENGQKYVDVDTDQDIFEGKTSAEYPRIVRDYIKNHFRGTVVGSESNKAYVDARTGQEYTNPANHRIEQNTFDSKMKAGTELDNLVSASTFAQHNEPDARHPEFPGGFDLYDVVFKVAGKTFRGRLNIGIDGRGRKRLYDLTQIKNLDNRVGVKQQGTAAAPSSNQDRNADGVYGLSSRSQNAISSIDTNSIAQKAANGKLSKQYSTKKWNALGSEGRKKAIAQMEVLAALATRTGRTIVVKDSVTTEDGRKANARYIHKDGVIEVALDMEEGAYAYAAVHELVHALKREHGSAWPEFRDFVLNALAEAGENVDALVQQQMERHGYGREKAIEEVVCNTVPAVLQDERNILKLYKGSKTLFERVVEWAKAMLDDVKRAGEALVKRGKSWAQMDALASDRAALQGIYDRLMSVMESQREETNGADEEASYSLRDTDENVQAALSAEEKAFAQVRSHRITDEEANTLAEMMLKESNSTFDKERLVEEIMRVVGYMENGENVDWKRVEDEMTRLAARVMEESQTKDIEHEEMAKPIRDYLRKTAIRLTENQKDEARNMMGTYRAYANRLFGRVRLSGKAGTPLDSLWGELNRMNAELFPADATEGDMTGFLMQAVDALKPVYHNNKGMNVEEAATWLAGKLKQGYFNLDSVEREAKNHKTFGESIRALNSALKRFEAHSWEEYQAALKQLETDVKGKLPQSAKEIAAIRAKYRGWYEHDKAERKERELRTKYRAKIERAASSLLKWYNDPTDARHIPDDLKENVMSMITVLDFSGKNTKAATSISEGIEKLRESLDKVSVDEEISSGEFMIERDQTWLDELSRLAKTLPKYKAVYELNSFELKELSTWMDTVRYVLTEANKMKATALPMTIGEAASSSIEEMSQKQAYYKKKGLTNLWNDTFGIEMQDSFTFFERLGPTAKMIFQGLRDGLDRSAKNIEEVQQETKELLKGVDVKKLDGKTAKKTAFKLHNDETVEMSKAQVMELYVLSRREQALGHLYGEGIVIQGDKNKMPHQLSKNDIENITSTLSKAEKVIAEGLQKILSVTCARWGNEVSMNLMRYKKFTEEYYWPIRTDPNTNQTTSLDAANDMARISAIRNQGHTKALTEGASNAIMIGSIFDSFTRHVSQMNAYSCYAIPLYDMQRWYNSRGVKRQIAQLYGKKGQDYIMNLLMTINGTVQKERSGITAPLQFLTRSAKIDAVAYNFQVAIQQPTSYARALDMMSAKYLIKAMKPINKKEVELMDKYCGIAWWKKAGFYETDVGPNLRRMLLEDGTVADWLKDKGMWLAGKGDEWTLRRLWAACEYETQDTMPELKPGSEEYYQYVGKRMSEVVDRTQVCDSPFHRSMAMRRKDSYTQLLTSFQSEAAKTYNLLMRHIADYWEHKHDKATRKLYRRKLGRSFVAFALSSSLAAIAKSVTGAIRDEEEEELDEKYKRVLLGDYREAETPWDYAKAALESNLGNALNPIGTIPVINDMFELILSGGENTTNLDNQSLQKLIWTVKEIKKAADGESKLSTYGVIYNGMRAVSSVTGVGVGNLMREVNAVAQTFGYNLTLNPTGTKALATETLYKAILAGDKDKQHKVREKMRAMGSKGTSDSEIDAAVGKLLIDNEHVIKAWEAKEAHKTENMNREKNKLTALGFTGEMVDKAIVAYGKTQETEEEEEKDLEKELKVRLFTETDAVEAMRGVAKGTVTEADAKSIVKELIADSTAKDPEGNVKSGITGEIKKDYLAAEAKGDTASMRRLRSVLKNVLDTDDADMAKWVKDAHGDQLREAIDSNNATAAAKMVEKMRTVDKKSDSDIKSSMSKYKEQYVQAMKEGDKATANRIKRLLQGLGLRGKNGKDLYSDAEFEKWMKED